MTACQSSRRGEDPPTAEATFRMLDTLQAVIQASDIREKAMLSCLLTGRQFHLFGKPVIATLSWPEGMPMSEENLRAYGETMVDHG